MALSSRAYQSMHYRNLALCQVLDALPSVFCWTLGKELFAECRTRQSPALGNDRIYREQDSQHRKTLGKEVFADCQTLGERRRSAKGRQQPSIADSRYHCRASNFSTHQRSFFDECLTSDTRRSILCRVPFVNTRQSIFLFFLNQTFCGMFIHYIDLHVPFWHNYKSIFYNY
jgi:hypothetical protein